VLLVYNDERNYGLMTTEPPIVIKDREELIFLLSEASALEHMIMCEYLFAAFSLKQDVKEGVTAAQLEAIKRWERIISLVATQEMLHLALVSNLLTSIGAIPFFLRPNFPLRSKYYPPGVQLALLPFGQDALQHFLYLERPEGMDLQDAAQFELLAAPRPEVTLDDDQIVALGQDFATVGHLYRGIEQGFRYLVDKYGEQQVFIGPPHVQATQQYFGWPELIPVTDLTSAVAAIETIVEQGEGARGNWRESHYGKFLQVIQEYRELKEQDARFEPARPVVPAFVRPPSDSSDITLIGDSLTAGVSELFNASYEVMLQMLIRYFVHSSGSETEDELRTLSRTAVDAMFLIIKPLGHLLTTLPVGPDLPGKTAGASFEMFRTGYFLPHHHAAWIVLHERLLELATFCGNLSAQPGAPKELAQIEAHMRRLATALAPHITTVQTTSGEG
jgi:hypothetical protein